MAPRMRYNPKTNRFEAAPATGDTQPPVPTTIDPIERARRDVAARASRRTTGSGDAKDRPGYRPPAAIFVTQPTTQTPAPAEQLPEDIFSRYSDDPALAGLLNSLFGSGGGGGGGTSRADRQRAARGIRRAGRQGQQQYNKAAEELFNRSMGQADEYYTGQENTARQQIAAATQEFLNNLIAPTAYQNMPLPNVPVAQQGLGESLASYGATGDLARQAAGETQAEMDFASQLSRNAASQIGQAQTDYFNALRNAATGGQAAALTNLTQNIQGLRGQSRAEADAMRRQLLMSGIEALIAGNTNAAQAML